MVLQRPFLWCLILSDLERKVLSYCLLFTEKYGSMEACYFYKKDNLSIQWRFFSEFWDEFSKAEIFFSCSVLTPIGFLLQLKTWLFFFFSFSSFLYLLVNGFSILVENRRWHSAFYLVIFSTWVFILILLSSDSEQHSTGQLIVSLWVMTTLSLIKRQGHIL